MGGYIYIGQLGIKTTQKTVHSAKRNSANIQVASHWYLGRSPYYACYYFVYIYLFFLLL